MPKCIDNLNKNNRPLDHDWLKFMGYLSSSVSAHRGAIAVKGFIVQSLQGVKEGEYGGTAAANEAAGLP